MKYAFFPGCSLQGMATEFASSAKLVCQQLGLGLAEAPNWSCCGATPAHASSNLLSLSLAARNLDELWKARAEFVTEAEETPPTMVAACASCYSRLRTANHEMRHEPLLANRVRKAAEIEYDGQVEVRHLLDVLVNDVGVEAIRERVKRPLEGLKVACYYGCLLVRPPKVVGFDDPENPRVMDDLLTAAGATCIDWPYKTECCGGSFSLARPDVVAKLVSDILREAKDAGADAIAVACPLCQTNLDVRQSDAAKVSGTRFDLPAFYFTQLLALALGAPAGELGLKRMLVSPEKALAAIGSAGS